MGGNRKLWGDEHEVTAVEYNEDIANVYKDYFPEDKIIIGDAHQYLLDHYREYDFIWSSPPCPTHSDIRRCGVHKGQYKALYPDMRLYQEIILLQKFARKQTLWVVENVRPYYEYLIQPSVIMGRHPLWSNFYIEEIKISETRKAHDKINGNEEVYGFNLKKYKGKEKKRKILRNLVNPEIGKYIINQATGQRQPREKTLFD